MPLVILHVATGDGADDIAYPRVIIEAAPGSSATIIEHHVTQGEHTPLTNSDTHIALRRDAQLEHYRVYATDAGATHFDSLNLHQDRDSRCKQFTIALGGGLVRTTLEAHLDKPGASLDSYSLLVGHREPARRLRQYRHPRRARYAQQSNGARHRQRRAAGSSSTAR